MQILKQISTYEEYEAIERELENCLDELNLANLNLVMYSIREAVNNAFEHGIKNNSSLAITITMETQGNEISVQVEHNGEGFDFEEIVMTMEDTDQYFMDTLYNTRGRGIAIMKKCAKDIYYSEGGRKLTLRFELGHD